MLQKIICNIPTFSRNIFFPNWINDLMNACVCPHDRYRANQQLYQKCCFPMALWAHNPHRHWLNRRHAVWSRQLFGDPAINAKADSTHKKGS